MSTFTDRILVQFNDPTQVAGLLAPVADAENLRITALLSAVYDQPLAKIHDVRDLRILRTEFERPVVTPRRRSGTWLQTAPTYGRTEVSYDDIDGNDPIWVDVVAEADINLLLEVDSGRIESLMVSEIEGFKSLDEFKARFQFLDIDAFLSQLGITTVDELKSRYHSLLMEVKLKPPVPFDANDPANLHRYPLKVGVLIRDLLDVTALLREAKQVRRALERSVVFQSEFDTADVRTPYALIVILPDAVLPGQPLSADALRAFFAAEQILLVFMTPA